ncbi:MAG TPA: hypothetical protein DCL41_04830 [Bdellovibrionales bacterium]|nr:hypothetical protein [Pseudobdellovibrionaceae bacterium]HAG91170.1 hypothetical protein [Bdellovibrionales bacterium]|tara:strand:- start:2791 stop:4110 length:1320 start_codon:yes stop_codon:yes gene_type:complete
MRSQMKSPVKFLIAFTGALLFLSGCADTVSTTKWESPKYQTIPDIEITSAPDTPAKKLERIVENGRGESNKYDPRVDILFVIDNSASMEVHQANLRRNIKKFVDAIAKTKIIDFHIGVTTVFDSSRYGSEVKKTCGGKQNYLENGELSPLKGVGPSENGIHFVTRREGYADVLEKTLNVGIADFHNASSGGSACSTGPEVEEVFSPILESFNEANQNVRNKDFWRKGSLKVVMIVTDAEDSTKDMTPQLVYEELYRLSESTPENQKFHIYAVAPPVGAPVKNIGGRGGYVNGNSKCRLDFGFEKLQANGSKAWPTTVPYHNIKSLVDMAGGDLLSICDSNYGAKLAAVGEKIRVATLKEIVFELKALPDVTEGRGIRVWFHRGENTSVALEQGKDWDYNAQDNLVVVQGIQLDWDKYPDAYISVDYFKFDPYDPNNSLQ